MEWYLLLLDGSGCACGAPDSIMIWRLGTPQEEQGRGCGFEFERLGDGRLMFDQLETAEDNIGSKPSGRHVAVITKFTRNSSKSSGLSRQGVNP